LWPAIRLGLQRHGIHPRRLGAVILTHRHVDHAGNAARLGTDFDVPIYAHAEDAAMLTGRTPRPPLSDQTLVGQAMCLVENLFPAPTCTKMRPLRDGDQIANLEVLAVPGHTEGSICLLHRASRTLFTGDALLNAVPPLTVKTALALPYPGFCDDYPQALNSLASLLEIVADGKTFSVCAGHGPQWRGRLRQRLHQMLRDDPLAQTYGRHTADSVLEVVDRRGPSNHRRWEES
jgi:glyoxylase-like metal-dependent hydrolase (beta-lactamase superfamily II)